MEFYRQEMLDVARQRWPTIQNLYDFECVFNVSAMDWFFNMTQKGFASTIIFNPGIKLVFIGGKVRTFKPDSIMPIYVSIVNLMIVTSSDMKVSIGHKL